MTPIFKSRKDKTRYLNWEKAQRKYFIKSLLIALLCIFMATMFLVMGASYYFADLSKLKKIKGTVYNTTTMTHKGSKSSTTSYIIQIKEFIRPFGVRIQLYRYDWFSSIQPNQTLTLYVSPNSLQHGYFEVFQIEREGKILLNIQELQQSTEGKGFFYLGLCCLIPSLLYALHCIRRIRNPNAQDLILPI